MALLTRPLCVALLGAWSLGSAPAGAGQAAQPFQVRVVLVSGSRVSCDTVGSGATACSAIPYSRYNPDLLAKVFFIAAGPEGSAVFGAVGATGAAGAAGTNASGSANPSASDAAAASDSASASAGSSAGGSNEGATATEASFGEATGEMLPGFERPSRLLTGSFDNRSTADSLFLATWGTVVRAEDGQQIREVTFSW